MAHQLFGGDSPKNYAIQGHPPLGSHEYVMVRGCPSGSYAPGSTRWHPRSDSGADQPDVGELKLKDKKGFYVYEISHSDWDAATRWVNNLAENVRYARKVHGDKILDAEAMAKFNDFWRRWLLFGNKIEVEKTKLKDESLASKILAATVPVYWASRKLAYTAQGVLALMSTDNKKELDALLVEGWKIYKQFRNLGMSQVAIPYMGELVVILRTTRRDASVADMAARLRDAAAVGTRLLDEHTAWWPWRMRDDSRGLAVAVADAKKTSEEFGELAKVSRHITRSEQVKAQEIILKILHKKRTYDQHDPIVDLEHVSPSAAVYDEFVRVLSKVFVEAAGLYGVEEVKKTARAGLADEPVKAAMTLGWLLALAGVGYLGARWLTRDKTTIVVESHKMGYHPDIDGTDEHSSERENDHGI
jgi:hypothetical protein